jgi:hypothetical protein
MNDKELRDKVYSAMYTLIKDKGFASPVDVLTAIGVLSKADCENWRFGRVDCLERVCKTNLKKLSAINREIRAYAKRHDMKASWTDYRSRGKGGNIRLRFSKSGDETMERLYATHYVGRAKVDEAVRRKENKKEEPSEN